MSVAVRWANWEVAGSPAGIPAGPLSQITFPITPLVGRVEIALGADPAADPATWSWLDITQWVRYDPGIQITFGRRDESSRVDASTARLTLDNRGGRFSRRNPNGPWFGLLSKNTPIRIGVDPGDGVHYRYFGFVNEWPTRWADKSGSDSFAPITCSGALRRLGNSEALRSPMFRAMSGVAAGDFRPEAYLPLEDGPSATQLAAGLIGGALGSTAGNVSLGAYSGAVGSSPVATLGSPSQISWALPFFPDTTVWQVQFMASIPAQPSSDVTYLDITQTTDSGGIAKFRFSYNLLTSSMRLGSYNAAGTEVDHVNTPFVFGGGTTQIQLGVPYMWAISSFVTAGNVATVLSQFDQSGNEVTHLSLSLYTGTPGVPYRVEAFGSSANSGWSLGHIGVYTDPAILTTPNIGPNASAIGGFAGETAHVRMIRLCREQGVSFTCTSATSARMGPQATGSLLDVLRDCEAADMGVLYEHEFGLGYQSLDDRLNTPAQLALDFHSAHIAETPEPADDDQQLVNRYSATRSGGTSATEQDDDSVAQAGVFAGSGSFSLFTDDQPRDVARWKTHLGTVDADRWPAIPIRLTGTPDLIPAWTSLPYGARMTVANPSGEVAPDTIDAIVEGWTETIQPPEWSASLNTTPASPYRVGKTANDTGDTDPFLGWLESDSCALIAAASGVDTTWRIMAEPVWTTTGDDFPTDIRTGGEVVTVTACASVFGDTFGRTSASGWTTADTGQAYTNSGGAATDHTVSGGTGRMSITARNTMFSASISESIADWDQYGTVTFPATPTGDVAEIGIRVRYVDANNFVDMRLFLQTSGSVSVVVRQLVAGVETFSSFVTVPSVTATTAMRWRIQAIGADLRAKAWPVSSAEPQAWVVSMTTGFLSAGGLFVYTTVPNTNTNVLPLLVQWDDLEAVRPQQWTVTRSRNGVAKAHAAGEPIELVNPIILVP